MKGRIKVLWALMQTRKRRPGGIRDFGFHPERDGKCLEGEFQQGSDVI